jgi:hypothetical protein
VAGASNAPLRRRRRIDKRSTPPLGADDRRHRQEAIMKCTAVAVVALMSLSSAASAQNGNSPSPAPPPNVAPYPASLNELYPGTTRLYQNANECAPDMARAIWGSGAVLLGYSCYYNPNW